MNLTILQGRIGEDPKTTTAGATTVTRFSLATTFVYYDANKKKVEKTDWHRITFWGKRGETISKFCAKGDQVTITGRIQYGKYEKDGVEKYTTDIIGSDFTFGAKGKNPKTDNSDIDYGTDGGYATVPEKKRGGPTNSVDLDQPIEYGEAINPEDIPF